jgi:PAS domain S-box-containing protein
MTTPLTTSLVSASRESAPARVLVVDDDEVDRLAVRRSLLKAGVAATVDDATSPDDVLERVATGDYQCVFLDYRMPGVDTRALLQRIQERARDVPVVILTGHGDEAIAVELMKSGAVDYLSKAALTAERLASTLRYALQTARAAESRRHVEHALREREAELRTLANSIPQLTWIADASGQRRWFNDRWYEYTGLSREQSLGAGWQVAHHPDHIVRVRDGQIAAFARGEAWEDTFPLRRRDGTYRWFLARAVPIRDEEDGASRWFGTHTDITDQKQGELERERLLVLEKEARAEAERATRARDEVLAVLAHDLRNLMHTVVASASVIELAADEDKRKRQIAILQRSTREMDRLMSDLLDVARIEAGTFAIRRDRVDVGALIREALELFDPQAVSRGIALGGDVPGSLPPVLADRDRLLQVLSNLLANALKFTPAEGAISVRAASLAETLQVSVEDSGSGIRQEDLPHVFDRFWQARPTSRVGAGLGLAICKGIVEAHGGRIWAESTLGRGTTLHFTLPLRGT